MVAFGFPVVPEVGASRATSSAAVATAWKLPLFAAQRLARLTGAAGKRSAVEHGRQAGRGGGQLVREAVVAYGEAGPGQLGQRGDLPGAQQRHGGDRYSPGLQRAEPRGYEPGVVRAPEQYPVPGDEAEVVGEHLGGLVRPLEQIPVGPGLGGGAQAGAVRAEAGRGRVQQGLAAVEPLRVAKLGQVETQVWPLIRGAAGCPGRRYQRARKARAASAPPPCGASRGGGSST